MDVENTVRMLEKDKKFDMAAQAKRYLKQLRQAYNPYVVVKDAVTDSCVQKLTSVVSGGKTMTAEQAAPAFKELLDIVKTALQKEKPNFFTLGYYMAKNPTQDVSGMGVAEMNKMTREYAELEANQASVEELEKFGAGRLNMATHKGDVENGSVMIGQICGMFHEIKPVATIIEELVGGIAAVGERVHNTLK